MVRIATEAEVNQEDHEGRQRETHELNQCRKTAYIEELHKQVRKVQL